MCDACWDIDSGEPPQYYCGNSASDDHGGVCSCKTCKEWAATKARENKEFNCTSCYGGTSIVVRNADWWSCGQNPPSP